MLIEIYPKPDGMQHINLMFCEEEPDPEDVWIRFQMQGFPVPPKRRFTEQRAGRQYTTLQFGQCVIGHSMFYIEKHKGVIDTIQRVAKIINAEQELNETVNSIKLELGNILAGPPGKIPPGATKETEEPPSLEFKVGQVVSPIASPGIRGAITSVVPGDPENRYDVFIKDSVKSFYASQLQVASESNRAPPYLPVKEFHSYLTSLQILHPGLANLYSLHAARINFIPYQFRPVLKFMRSDRPRLLVADSVGVGKTIEAGLILRELQARSEVNSVLVICTKPLVVENKWKDEMKRFDERFTQLDGKTFRYCIDEMDKEGAWPTGYKFTRRKPYRGKSKWSRP